MTRLPIHARTGLTAIGVRRDGRPIWPVLGGDGTEAPPVPAPPPTPPAQPPGQPAPASQPSGTQTPPTSGEDDPLGPAGLKALQAEREARAALERRLTALEPLAKLASAMGVDPGKEPTDADKLRERQSALEKELADERQARWRAEVAQEKKLTAAQATRLVGTTREDLLADADALLSAFPTAAPPDPAKPGAARPKPDPAQGARPGDKPAASTSSGKSLYEQRHPKKSTASTS